MKPAALTVLLLLFLAATTSAQLSFLPQLGFERSKTSVQVNNGSSFSPMDWSGNFRANFRMDYRFKKGHGPYAAIGTTPGAVSYSFSNPAMAANSFKAANRSRQLRLEGGYQYSTKPINFKKTTTKETPKTTTQTEVRRGCSGSYYYYPKQTTHTATAKQKSSLNMRLQPSLGLAYLPSAEENLKTDPSGYVYNAGNYKTALVSGLGFEFGKGKHRLFTLSLFYTKGLGISDQQISSIENDKVNYTTLNSKASSWGAAIGVPFSFTKNKKPAVPVKATTEQKHEYKSKCGSYQGRCTKRI